MGLVTIDLGTTNPHKLRIALIGAGRHAQHHARAILRCTDVELIAAVDPSEAALTAMRSISPGLRGYATPEALFAEEILDAVHICTPPSTHAQFATLALEAGCSIYVEKPFTEQASDAQAILALADRHGLKVCAGHQLLQEPPTRIIERYLTSIGRVVHVESYFSFRPIRHAPGGRKLLRADKQLLDILPHPVYLLLRVLEHAGPGPVELSDVSLSDAGTVHALIRSSGITGNLVVTLEGRPVESYLRVVGTKGSLFGDYVRGTVLRALGPGSSGIDKLFAPYRQAWQILAGSTAAFGRRLLKKQRSYPGLAEMFDSFYQSIRHATAAPLSPESIVATVRICERVAEALQAAESSRLASSKPRPMDGSGVLLTGGTGFLGKRIVRALLDDGKSVRVLARREPPAWERVSGAEYLAADLASGVDSAWFAGVDTVIHAAAETAGGWEEHQRNSLDATEQLLRGSSQAGVQRFLHVSSIAVLAKGSGTPIGDDHPLERDSGGSGPYVWGKLESERRAVELGRELGVEVKVVRPGALVDYRDFEPPGRLGKRLGNIFVAVGAPGHCLGVADVEFSGRVLTWMVSHWSEAPDRLNLLDPVMPTKRELLAKLKGGNPDLTVIWLPTVVLIPLSWLATGIQKALRPRKPAINIAKVFSVQNYTTTGVSALVSRMTSERTSGPIAEA